MPEKNNFKDRILNCIPSRNPELDWTLEDAVEAEILEVIPAIPESKDLREDWWKINDQKNRQNCSIIWCRDLIIGVHQSIRSIK